MDGSRPFLLYAYGSYGSTMEPTFDSDVLSLVDRGFGYGIAHIRGGQEMGRRWYDDGKMMKKKNTFNDFIDVAEYLVRERYTSPSRLVANGASAGGLLMGVVATWRPGSVPRGRRGRAVRGRDQHHARRLHPAHRPGVGAVGESAQSRALRLHEELLALRQRGGEGVSRRCWSPRPSTIRR